MQSKSLACSEQHPTAKWMLPLWGGVLGCPWERERMGQIGVVSRLIHMCDHEDREEVSGKLK